MTPISDDLLNTDLDLMFADWAEPVSYKQATGYSEDDDTGIETVTYTTHSVTGIVSEPSSTGFKGYPDRFAKYDRLLHLRASDLGFEPQNADRVVIGSTEWRVDYAGLDGSGTKWLLGLASAK